jgi:hypothetical protein
MFIALSPMASFITPKKMSFDSPSLENPNNNNKLSSVAP